MSLWGVKQAISSAKNEFLFPRYCNKHKCKADYASSTLNKWLRGHVPDGCVVHSFRHSMRDRLRAVQCPFVFAHKGQSNSYPNSWPNTCCVRTGLALSTICHSNNAGVNVVKIKLLDLPQKHNSEVI